MLFAGLRVMRLMAEERIEETTKDKKAEIRTAFAKAFPNTVPVLAGYLALGIGFGVLMETSGYGAGWSALASVMIFGGSIQYVAITLFSQPFAPLSAFFLSLLVNIRHIFYGISMFKKYNGLGKIRYFLIFALTDETYSITSAITPPDDVNKKYFYFFISFLDYTYWIIGSFIGGLLGAVLEFNSQGIDFVLTALFTVLFVDQVRTGGNRIPGAIGIICATLATVILGPDNTVIGAMVLIMVTLLAGRRKLC